MRKRVRTIAAATMDFAFAAAFAAATARKGGMQDVQPTTTRRQPRQGGAIKQRESVHAARPVYHQARHRALALTRALATRARVVEARAREVQPRC